MIFLERHSSRIILCSKTKDWKTKKYNMTYYFGFVSKRVYKSPIYYDIHALMIMTYLAVVLYPFAYKAKTARHRNNVWKG